MFNSFKNWLSESLHGIERAEDFADRRQRRILDLDKTNLCLKQKIENVGIPVKFVLIKANNYTKIAPNPNMLIILRDDQLTHPLTCWMILHQVGHAMHDSQTASHAYRKIDELIGIWGSEYLKLVSVSENTTTHNEPPPDLDDYQDYTPAPSAPITQPKRVVPPKLMMNDLTHRRNLAKAHATITPYGTYNRDFGHIFLCKFLKFKSARDTWARASQYFANFGKIHSSIDQYKGGGGAAFTAPDELLNELIAEYLWNNKRIRYQLDQDDPYVQAKPNGIPELLAKIESVIGSGLQTLKGQVITLRN